MRPGNSPTGRRARTRCCCTARTSRSRRSRAWPRRWPTCRRTTRRAWSRWTSPPRPRTANACWPSGRGATTARRSRRSSALVAVTAETLLELRRIRKDFGAFTALHDIDLAIAKGEFVCFLGPSGCGKTTLLRIVAGLETQSAGAIFQSGRDISRLPPAERDYGIVFQSYALFPNLSVADNVAY